MIQARGRDHGAPRSRVDHASIARRRARVRPQVIATTRDLGLVTISDISEIDDLIAIPYLQHPRRARAAHDTGAAALASSISVRDRDLGRVREGGVPGADGSTGPGS
ncbi:MAG: hypothetical protein ACTHU0_10935 [Kofleriaceae bacterium]